MARREGQRHRLSRTSLLIEATAHRERVSTDLAECQRALVAARDHRDRLDRQLAEDRTRLDVLRRLHESGTGLHAGVREVLSAGRSGRLQGIRGTVAELLDVPQRYEVAIEVALGGRLQDLVVETWPDAEAAIAMLKHTGAGRATFHPLDTIRSGRGRLDIAIARVTGVHGIASELLTVAPDITPVIAALLGRTVVVDDLDIARIVLPKLASGWSAVTLGGEIARAGGSVTGGAPTRESGTLGRERELRELPDQVAHGALTELHVVPSMHLRKAAMESRADAFAKMARPRAGGGRTGPPGWDLGDRSGGDRPAGLGSKLTERSATRRSRNPS